MKTCNFDWDIKIPLNKWTWSHWQSLEAQSRSQNVSLCRMWAGKIRDRLCQLQGHKSVWRSPDIFYYCVLRRVCGCAPFMYISRWKQLFHMKNLVKGCIFPFVPIGSYFSYINDWLCLSGCISLIGSDWTAVARKSWVLWA